MRIQDIKDLGDFFNFIFDGIFQFSYIIAMFGAVFYAIIELFNIEIVSIFAHRYASVFFNIFISIAGFLSIFAFFDSDVPFFSEYLIDRYEIKKNIKDVPVTY